MELGIVNDFNAVHPENADAPNVVTELPSTNDSTLSFESEIKEIEAYLLLSIVKFFILLQLLKAEFSIEKTEEGILIVDSSVQPSKA